jgi:hypothetical protein
MFVSLVQFLLKIQNLNKNTKNIINRLRIFVLLFVNCATRKKQHVINQQGSAIRLKAIRLNQNGQQTECATKKLLRLAEKTK